MRCLLRKAQLCNGNHKICHYTEVLSLSVATYAVQLYVVAAQHDRAYPALHPPGLPITSKLNFYCLRYFRTPCANLCKLTENTRTSLFGPKSVSSISVYRQSWWKCLQECCHISVCCHRSGQDCSEQQSVPGCFVVTSEMSVQRVWLLHPATQLSSRLHVHMHSPRF